MTIYVEIVFITNFFIDYFIFFLTNMAMKGKPERKRMMFACLIGALLSCIYPLVVRYGFIMKIVGMFLLPMFFRKNRSIREYSLCITIFVGITFLLGGILYLLKSIVPVEIIYHFSYGFIPILFSLAGTILLSIMVEVRKKFLSIRQKNALYRTIRISDGNKTYIGEAFFDSGNRVFTNNGEPVTMVPERIYTMFGGTEETLAISTVTGATIVKTKAVELMIYNEEKENSIYKVKIACAPNASVNEIILNGTMDGG